MSISRRKPDPEEENPEEGNRLANEGASAAWGAADEDWKSRAVNVLNKLIASGEPFTQDDVTREVGLPGESVPNGNNSVGQLCRTAHQQGRTVYIKHVPTQRTISRGRKISLWRGIE